MQVYPRHSRCPGGQSLGQETRDDPGQHVAGTGRGQTRIGEGAEQRAALRCGNDSVGSFERHHLLPAGGCILSDVDPLGLHIGDCSPKETGHFPRMGGEHVARRQAFPPARRFGQGIKPVGVNHRGWKCYPGRALFFLFLTLNGRPEADALPFAPRFDFQQLVDKSYSIPLATQARPHQQRLVVRQMLRQHF